MSSWIGSILVNVVNGTGSAITQAGVFHQWHNVTMSVGPTSLGPGDSTSFTVTTGSGSNDFWTVGFTLGGNSYTADGKQCNIEQEDVDSGLPMSIYFGLSDWNVQLPKSSSCMNNSYFNGGLDSAALGIGSGINEPAPRTGHRSR